MGLKDLRAKARFDDSVITTALRPWLKEIKDMDFSPYRKKQGF
jgi:hypothetical protein